LFSQETDDFWVTFPIVDDLLRMML